VPHRGLPSTMIPADPLFPLRTCDFHLLSLRALQMFYDETKCL
jgi:hypothetical protein